MIRVIVVDDEPLARTELTNLIEEDKSFKVIAHASNGREALEKIKKNQVDVVFLDVEMPGLSGTEVAKRIEGDSESPLVVFASAYDQYALEAFASKGVDYVLKPYEPERIQKTLDRVRELIQTQRRARDISPTDQVQLKGTPIKLIGRRRNARDRIVVDPRDVFYFHAHLTEVVARLENSELIVGSSLKDLEDNLDKRQFARTHKAYIVNLDKVSKVSPMFSGNHQLSLSSENLPKIPLSRRYAKSLKNRLGNW